MIFDNQQPQVEMISVTKSFKYSYEITCEALQRIRESGQLFVAESR